MSHEETRWWWVRHAPVPDGGRIYGQSDLDCDCSDPVAFAALAQELPRNAFWVTSHLARTKQTAAAIVRASQGGYGGTQPLAVPELAEQHLGDLQGLDRKEFAARPRSAPHPFWFGAASERTPNGESFQDLVERTIGAVERISADNRGRDIIAVAHGGTIRAALGLALGLSPDAVLAFVIDNCSITRIDHLAGQTNHWRVVSVNHRPWLRTAVRSGHAVA